MGGGVEFTFFIHKMSVIRRVFQFSVLKILHFVQNDIRC